MFDRNTSKIGSMAVVTFMIISAVFAGGAAAQMDSPTLVDSTIEPTNETQSVYVDVTGIDDMNGSGPVSVDVSITGLNASDDTLNGTTVDSQTLSVTQGNVSTYDYTLNQSDIDDYDELQIDSSVVTDGDESLIDSVDWGSLVENAGGAGGGLGGDGGLTGMAAIVVLAFAAIVATRGDDS